MALTTTQKLKVRLALCEPLEVQSAIDVQIARLDSDAETYLTGLITQWDTVAQDTTEIVVDGVTISPEKTRKLLASQIGQLIGWYPSDNGSILMGRGFVEDYSANGYSRSQSRDSDWEAFL